MSTPSTAHLISYAEVLGFIKRRIALILVGLLVGGAGGFLGSDLITKRYRSKAVLTIQSGYFYHPLISDVVAGPQDIAEMSFQRAALIRLALNPEFLESFGRRYFIKSNPISGSPKPLDTELLMRNIDYFATNPMSFQITVTTTSPETALSATSDVLNQIIKTLAEQRHQHLTGAYNSLVQQATLVQRALMNGTSTSERGSIESRISVMRSKLATLQQHLADTHPEVLVLKKQLNALISRAGTAPPGEETSGESIPEIFLFPQSQSTGQEILADLLKKISYLAVVLHTEPEQGGCPFVDIIERPRPPLGPFSPHPVQFALIGGAIGLIVSLTIAVTLELRRTSEITPTEAGVFLDMQLLGELPALPATTKLSSSAPTRVVQSLALLAKGLTSV